MQYNTPESVVVGAVDDMKKMGKTRSMSGSTYVSLQILHAVHKGTNPAAILGLDRAIPQAPNDRLGRNAANESEIVGGVCNLRRY
jgi:hypothetical protein